MKNTQGGLVISFQGGVSSANPSIYPLKKGDCVPVTVHGDCRVCFDRTDIFPNRHHRDGQKPKWCPKKNVDATVYYEIIDPGDECSRDIAKTYSIKIGSGIETKR